MGISSMQILENKIKDLAATDKDFRKNLIASPKKAIKDKFNVTVPDSVEIKVSEDTAKLFNLVLPPMIGSDEVGAW